MNVQVIYEDNHLIAVNKPAGVLVQPDDSPDKALEELVKEYIKIRYEKPGDVFLGVIHRLDRPVSGCVVFARTSKALVRMNQLFKDRQIEKNYWAITAKRPEQLQATLVHYVEKDTTRNISRALDQMSNRAKDAKRSELHYRLAAEMENRFLLEVQPVTGRPHQIRVQLAKIGCPIVGDVKYGYPTPQPNGAIYLHCHSLAFQHPVKQTPVRITADPPDDDRLWDQMPAAIVKE